VVVVVFLYGDASLVLVVAVVLSRVAFVVVLTVVLLRFVADEAACAAVLGRLAGTGPKEALHTPFGRLRGGSARAGSPINH